MSRRSLEIKHVVENFIQLRGEARLNEFIEALSANETYADIGRKFDLTRERVRQLANILTTRSTYVQPRPEVVEEMRKQTKLKPDVKSDDAD